MVFEEPGDELISANTAAGDSGFISKVVGTPGAVGYVSLMCWMTP